MTTWLSVSPWTWSCSPHSRQAQVQTAPTEALRAGLHLCIWLMTAGPQEADSKGEWEVGSSTGRWQCGLHVVVGGANSSWNGSMYLDSLIPDGTVLPSWVIGWDPGEGKH